MQLGIIGLGRMGANMAKRLLRAKHQCVVYDHHAEHVQTLVAEWLRAPWARIRSRTWCRNSIASAPSG
jgi:6-phosphogluconate dehydrogenase (decarboxylating)